MHQLVILFDVVIMTINHINIFHSNVQYSQSGVETTPQREKSNRGRKDLLVSIF